MNTYPPACVKTAKSTLSSTLELWEIVLEETLYMTKKVLMASLQKRKEESYPIMLFPLNVCFAVYLLYSEF